MCPVWHFPRRPVRREGGLGRRGDAGVPASAAARRPGEEGPPRGWAAAGYRSPLVATPAAALGSLRHAPEGSAPWSALRLRSGVLGLHWEDLDLRAGTAAIRRTLQRTSAGGLTTLPTKTRASERRIALAARCLQSLKRHHEQQQREREAAGTTWQHDGTCSRRRTADRSTRPTSPAPSPRSSARPATAASASTTSGTRPRPCFWNRASNSS